MANLDQNGAEALHKDFEAINRLIDLKMPILKFRKLKTARM
jgi:hypothetical protein